MTANELDHVQHIYQRIDDAMECAAASHSLGQPEVPLSVHIDVSPHDGPDDIGQSSDRWEGVASPARKAGAMSAWARMRVGDAARALDARWRIVDSAIALDERLAGGHVGRAALHVSKAAAGAVSLPSSASGAAALPALDAANAWPAAGAARRAWVEFCAGWSDETVGMIDMHVDADQQFRAPAATAEHDDGWDEGGCV